MYTIKLKCPKHPRYDPARDGQAAVRGGCAKCLALYDLYRAADETRRILTA